VVLVVEDHGDSADMFRRLLRMCGVDRVAIVSSAVEALKVLHAGGVRAAVIDYNLPDRDGYSLFQEIVRDHLLPPSHVIFLSGTYEKDVIANALATGAGAWYVKGVDEPRKVIDLLKRLCDATS